MTTPINWITRMMCPYCGSDDTEWNRDDACVTCNDCGEADCL